MLETFSGLFVFIAVVPVTLAGLAVSYVALRVRDSRAEPADPQLGFKAACYAFLTFGVLLALTGLSISVIDLLGDAMDGNQANQPQQPPVFNPKFGPMPQPQPRPAQNDPFDSVSQRVAWPLVISGCLFALGSLFLIRVWSNDLRFPAARRTFAGLRLSVCGLTAMAGVTYLILLAFQKEGAVPNTRAYAAAIGTILIWGPAAGIHLFMLKSYSELAYFVPPKEKKVEVWVDDFAEDAQEEGRGEEVPRKRRRPPRREDDED